MEVEEVRHHLPPHQLESEDSWGELASLFTTCTPLDGTNDMDVKSFMELVIDNLAGIVQYNGLQNQDIFSVCAILTDESVGSPLERLAAVNTLMLSEVIPSQNIPPPPKPPE